MSIELERLSKRYGALSVVQDLSLAVAKGEFLVLLGPSGSGKSTVLRMIAGLVPVDAGRIVLDGRDVTDLPPQARGAGLVFQNYALFRHLTVEENVEFALAVRRVPRAARRERAARLLELVGLAGLGRRLPRQLSGGQQQRVALARALAHEPRVLLLDEPFGALDARIRAELRRSLKTIQRELGVVTLFVTHDQQEAFELGDRIALLSAGRLIEVGEPHELYLTPQHEFTATFLGQANLFVGEAVDGRVRIGPLELPHEAAAASRRRVQVLFRPEDVELLAPEAPATPGSLGVGTVESVAFAGAGEQLRLRLPPRVGVRAIAPRVPFGADWLPLEAARGPHEVARLPLAVGDRAQVAVRRLHALAHPGLHLLAAVDRQPQRLAVLDFAAALAERAQARLTVLSSDPDQPREALATAQRQLPASGARAAAFQALASDFDEALERQVPAAFCDLALVATAPGEGEDEAEALLADGEHHLLLVRRAATPLPRRALLAVRVGEPGKGAIAFAGRLLRHLSPAITLLTVAEGGAAEEERLLGRRFLESGRRTLEQLGLAVDERWREGEVAEAIAAELAQGHDLLVVGAPLRSGHRGVRLGALLSRLIAKSGEHPLLIVRTASEPGGGIGGRA